MKKTRFVVAVAAKDSNFRQKMESELDGIIVPELGSMIQLCEGEFAPSRGVTVLPGSNGNGAPSVVVNCGTAARDNADDAQLLINRMRREGWVMA